MKAYVDSSVVLRIIFGEPNPLQMPKQLEYTLASEILKIECFRSIDRMRHALRLADEDVAERSALLHQAIRTIRFVKLADEIAERASQAFPTTIKTLDAIHLATAIHWQQNESISVTFLTHDEQLGRSARAMGFEVLGC
jgi:predicted nucleic acid-binding protein